MTDDLCRVPPEVLVYAARYARGRLTGAPIDVLHAIEANANRIREHPGCRKALVEELHVPGWPAREIVALRRALDALDSGGAA